MEMRQIPNFPDYFVTDEGRVFSDRYSRRWGKGNWLHLLKHIGGYLFVNLRNDGKPIIKLVHRLVLEAFVGECPIGMECRHLNGDRIDNRLENLCWGTRSENNVDAVRHGTCNLLRQGEEHPASKLTEKQVLEIDRLYKTGDYTQEALGEMFNIGNMTISCIVRHETWKYLWEEVHTV